ncbi:DNA primase [Picosynechococcus sp. PCC 11901]|uniref:DNA primase n=1 Tax=Picosynechococcus sp. PCC 11901 TaxID=2579791 RepID=UPI0010FBFCB0|nr:DNA primase [Picosynechococcus sp. PCC 11901]QCS49912.1 DNA primase [Picosynechococcus sp. PCC 11901]
MAYPSIHPDTIEEIRAKVDIAEVVSDYVVLKKRGKDLLGLCPFHDEKTPSFTVSPTKQFYHCFGCGAGGNAIKFLMEINKSPFAQVVLDLAQRYQVPVKTLEPEQHQEIQRELSLKEQLYEIVAIANDFYQYSLRQPEGQTALAYVREQRRLTEATIQNFGLGYAPGGWDTLYHYLVEQKRYPIDLVEKAGLIKPRQSGNGHYDQFRDRLMIPIYDVQGRAIAFGSRTLTNEEPKYLNSPETPLFDKSRTLFALDQAKGAIAKQDAAVVVEGYFDAIALHAAGFDNVVASLGTAFTQGQIKQLLRYTDSKQIIFNFDADKAGIKATQRTLTEIEPLIYSGQAQVRILNLPGGKDADEFLQTDQGPAQYQTALTTAPLWLDWQLEQILLGQDVTQADQFQGVIKQMIRLIAKIDHPSFRSHYIAKASELINHEDSHYKKQLEATLLTQVNRFRKAQARNPTAIPEVQPEAIALSSQTIALAQAEELLLRIYLHSPAQRHPIEARLAEKEVMFSLSHHRWLWQQILETPLEIKQNHVHNQLLGRMLDILTHHPERMHSLGSLLYLTETTEIDVRRATLNIHAAIATLEHVNWTQHRRYCQEKWQGLDPQHPDFAYYLREFEQADRKLKAIAQERQFSHLEILHYET